MNIWMMMLPCIGLALDDFILMMGKGATLKDLTTEKTVAYASMFGGVNLAAALISVISIAAIGVDAEAGKIALIFLANFVMQLEIMAITFGISAFLKSNGIGIGIGISFGLYFLNILSNLEDGLEFIGKITPFGYANSGYIIEYGKIELLPILIGIALTGGGIALAFWQYNKKDIS